ncbi:MAG: flagellar FliJ family protein [Legionellales bacterium]
MKRRVDRFQLIKKIKTNQQRELVLKIADLRKLCEKKELVIHSFELYLSEYQNKMVNGQALSAASFINFQSFLNQIARVLQQERDELAEFSQRIHLLTSDYIKTKHQIDGIEEAILNLKITPN